MLRLLFFLFCLKQCCSFIISDNASFVNYYNRLDSVAPYPPDHWDLREVGMVTPVKNQMDCAACWAFSVIGNIETRMKMYRHTELILSEQFLIDCFITQGGCHDGSIVEAYIQIVAYFYGVILQEDYPYANGQQSFCGVFPTLNNFEEVSGFKRVIGGEDAMLMELLLTGPLSAAINSESMARWTYEEGAVDEPSEQDCNPNKLNHAVVIVGYSVAKRADGSEVPYWIIKNSWGTEFGDKGFYYLVRGRNACGIANDVSYPILQLRTTWISG